MKLTTVLLTIGLYLVILLSGCQESQQRPTYGTGDPPVEFQEYFGNDNGARLDFVQNKAISELVERIQRLERPDLEATTAYDAEMKRRGLRE